MVLLVRRSSFHAFLCVFLAVVALFLSMDTALASRPLTLEEQAHVNVLRRHRPDVADKLEKRLKKLEDQLDARPDLTDEQKNAARQQVFAGIKDQLREESKAAKEFGTPQQASEIENLRTLVNDFEYRYLHPGDRILFSNLPAEMLAEYRAEYQRLRDEARKAEEARPDSSGGIAPEHSRADSAAPGIYATVGGSIGERKAPKQRYMATEIGGILTVGILAQDRDVEVDQWEASLRYAGEFGGFRLAQGAGETVIEPHFSSASGKSNQDLGAYSTAPGDGIGVIGTGDPLANYPAGNFHDDLNDLTGLNGSYKYSATDFGVKFAQDFRLSEHCSYQAFVDISYRSTKESQSFGGYIPFYFTDFDYDTRIRLNTFKVDLGARFEHQLAPTFGVFAEPSASLNIIKVKGWDSLDLTGFLNDSQRVDLSASEVMPGARLKVGFDWEPEQTPFEVYVGASVAYEPDSAIVYRSGVTGEQSEANMKYTKSYGLSSSLTYKF